MNFKERHEKELADAHESHRAAVAYLQKAHATALQTAELRARFKLHCWLLVFVLLVLPLACLIVRTQQEPPSPPKPCPVCPQLSVDKCPEFHEEIPRESLRSS